MTASNESKQRITAIAAVVGVLLCGIIAFLLYNKASSDEIIARQTTEINEAEQLKTELDKQYYEALSELEEMKGNNEELNALIESQKDEIKAQKSKISGLISSGKANRRDLEAARTEIQTMMAQRDQYVAEINTLKNQNEQLSMANSTLTSEKTSLQEEVAVVRTNVENLSAEKAVLVSEKEELEDIKEDLSKKVNFGSVIRAENVNATGWKVKKSGKPVKKNYAKNVDEMKVCFSTTVNELAQNGSELFHIRVINPIGETMAIEEMGSGVFTNSRTQEEIRFTQAKEVEYNQDEGLYCFNWAPGIPFQKGNYDIEVYNKGYLTGQGTCTLK